MAFHSTAQLAIGIFQQGALNEPLDIMTALAAQSWVVGDDRGVKQCIATCDALTRAPITVPSQFAPSMAAAFIQQTIFSRHFPVPGGLRVRSPLKVSATAKRGR
jgi:hypothetical protein